MTRSREWWMVEAESRVVASQADVLADLILREIASAKQAERERCIKAVCGLCATGDNGFEKDGIWMHEYDDTLFGVTERARCGCTADDIRRLDSTRANASDEGGGV